MSCAECLPSMQSIKNNNKNNNNNNEVCCDKTVSYMPTVTTGQVFDHQYNLTSLYTVQKNNTEAP